MKSINKIHYLHHIKLERHIKNTLIQTVENIFLINNLQLIENIDISFKKLKMVSKETSLNNTFNESTLTSLLYQLDPNKKKQACRCSKFNAYCLLTCRDNSRQRWFFHILVFLFFCIKLFHLYPHFVPHSGIRCRKILIFDIYFHIIFIDMKTNQKNKYWRGGGGGGGGGGTWCHGVGFMLRVLTLILHFWRGIFGLEFLIKIID